MCLLGLLSFFKNRITVSVIIPVYNAEKYLSRCLDSVFTQSGSYEVITINDGSTDKSLAILQEYAKKHSNLTIINQKNQGVSAARNKGLEVAKNKYVTFVDSDDWLEPDAFKRILKVIRKDKPDIVLTGFYDVYDYEWVEKTRGREALKEIGEENKFADRKLDKLQLFSPFYGSEAHSDLYYAGGGIRGRFYLKEFIEKNKINFPTEIACHEDDVFIFRAYLHNPLISIVSAPIYNYRNRVDSISKSQVVLKNMSKSLAVMQETEEYKQADRRTQMFINDNWLSLVFLGLANLRRHNAPFGTGLKEAYEALRPFNVYNKEELKSTRNYPQLITFLKQFKTNQPL